jgi:orotate phosphoribosyltransferase
VGTTIGSVTAYIGKGVDVRDQLLRLLAQHSYERADCPKFKLASGVASDTYIDAKATTTLADAGPLIGAVYADLIPQEADSIGGLTMGADPIAYAVSAYFMYVKCCRLNSFVVRKAPKDHGKKRYIEGNPGKQVVIVDDVVTTGGSTIQAIQRCREAGITVLAVIVLVDREESDGLATIRTEAGADVPVRAIFTKSELEGVAKDVDTASARHRSATG